MSCGHMGTLHDMKCNEHQKPLHSTGTAEAFFSWSGQIMRAPRNFYHFNYIHDHDVINIVPLWCAHLPIARLAQRLAPAFDSAQAPACAKSSNVATPLIFSCGLAL